MKITQSNLLPTLEKAGKLKKGERLKFSFSSPADYREYLNLKTSLQYPNLLHFNRFGIDYLMRVR